MNSRVENTQFQAIKTKFEKWTLCPITQEKIILPAMVYYKQDSDSEIETMRLYEYAAIMQHREAWLTNGKSGEEDKLLDPTSRQPMTRPIALDFVKTNEFRLLAKQAREMNVIDEKTFQELDEKYLIGVLHYQVEEQEIDRLCQEITNLRNAGRVELINRVHYVTGKPLLHEVIRQSSPRLNQYLASSALYMLLTSYEEFDLCRTSEDGMTGLMQAAKSSCFDAFTRLISVGDINATDKLGNTALHHVLGSGSLLNLELMFRLAIDKGANVLLANRAGRTPLSILVTTLGDTVPLAKEALTRCVKYVAEMQPHKILECAEQSKRGLNDKVDLFRTCISKFDLEAAQALVLAGIPINVYMGDVREEQSVLHFLAKESCNPALTPSVFNRVVRMMEFLVKQGMVCQANAAGVTPQDMVASNAACKVFSVNLNYTTLVKQRKWLFFANYVRASSNFGIDLAEILLRGIFSNPEDTFQYKMCLELIIQHVIFKLTLFKNTKDERTLFSISNPAMVSADKFAIDHNNIHALMILMKLKMLSTTQARLYDYAKLKNASAGILDLLQPAKPSNVIERRHSFSMSSQRLIAAKPATETRPVEVNPKTPKL